MMPCRLLGEFKPQLNHYSDVIMSEMASKITGIWTVCSSVCSGTDQRKHQCSASLAFVRGIKQSPVISPHKGPGPCITNVFATRRKNFSQWHRSFQRKLLSHWLKFLRHVAITLVIQDPVTRKMFSFDGVIMASPHRGPMMQTGLSWYSKALLKICGVAGHGIKAVISDIMEYFHQHFLRSCEYHQKPLLMSQNWIRYWFGALRQYVITWANVDPNLYHNKALACNSGLTSKSRVTHRCVSNVAYHWFW